jgi:hypothetical protein
MFKKPVTFFGLLLCLVFAQHEAAFAKKAKHKSLKAAPIVVVPSDPTPVQSVSTLPHSNFAMIPDPACGAGNMKVDFKAKNFSFAAYMASQQSTALDATP